LRRRPVGFPALCVATLGVVLVVAALQRGVRMDARFFGDSMPAHRALLHYLVGDYANAAHWYRVALAASIVDAEQRSSWGALRAGNHAAAEVVARRELGQEPRAVQPRLTLAEVALARGQDTEALEHIGQALQLRPDDHDALLLATVAHAHRKDWSAAIDTLKRALRQDRVERRYTVFLATLEATGDVASSSNPPLCLLAHLHRYLRIYDPARADSADWYARRAIDAGDRADDAWVTIAIVYDTQGKRRHALEAFLRALAVNPANTAALLGTARLRADRGEIAAEYRLLRRAFQATPDDPFVADRLHAALVHKLGDYRQALAMEQTLVAERPDDARAWWRLGAVQLALGDHQAALDSLDRSAKLADLPETHEARGYVLRELQRTAEATEAYQRSIDLDPSRPGGYVGLAVLLARQRRYPQALATYERAYRLGARDAEQVVDLCSLYYEVGKVGQALGCLGDLLTREPDNVRGRALLEHVQRTASVRRAA